jgi:N-acetylneuraminic acid mutarotase
VDSSAVKFLLHAFASLAFAASAAAGTWSSSERLETARSGLAATSVNDMVYVGGGAGAGDPSNAFDMFDGAKEAWRPLPALPKGLMNFAMAASDRYVFIAGGFAADAPGEPRKDVWAYDIDGAGWQRRSSMPYGRAGHAMAQVGGRIYVIGGNGPSADKTLIYDPASDKWQTASGLGAPRRALAAATDGKRIYAVGGFRPDGSASNALEVFDPAGGVWSALPPLPNARGALTAGFIKGQLHVAGGSTMSPLKSFANHDVFDLGSRTWSRSAPMPTARQGLASGVGGGRWWVIGGGSGAGVFGVFTASDAVEGYEP